MDYKLMIILFIMVSFTTSHYSGPALGSLNISRFNDMVLEEKLIILNKPAIETFKSNEGRIIDCVDINKQPALDHPLLQNHKVQIRPSSEFPARFEGTSSNHSYANIFGIEACPSGTVPIPRVNKEDLIRARTSPKMPFAQLHCHAPVAATNNPSQIVINLMTTDKKPKLGVGGIPRVYSLKVGGAGQFSSISVWIQAGPVEHISMITAGWMVNPTLYGDGDTRLYTYWTGDGYRNGCYNTLCSGFVQVDKQITPDIKLSPVSTFGGDQFEFEIVITQDPQTKNWWLLFKPVSAAGPHGLQNFIKVGYWPNDLFLNFKGNGVAETVAWGGVSKAANDGISPPIGSGQKPDGDNDYTRSCLFHNLNYVNEAGNIVKPGDKDIAQSEDSTCFGLINHGNSHQTADYAISLGGPGGKCN